MVQHRTAFKQKHGLCIIVFKKSTVMYSCIFCCRPFSHGSLESARLIQYAKAVPTKFEYNMLCGNAL